MRLELGPTVAWSGASANCDTLNAATSTANCDRHPVTLAFPRQTRALTSDNMTSYQTMPGRGHHRLQFVGCLSGENRILRVPDKGAVG